MYYFWFYKRKKLKRRRIASHSPYLPPELYPQRYVKRLNDCLAFIKVLAFTMRRKGFFLGFEFWVAQNSKLKTRNSKLFF